MTTNGNSPPQELPIKHAAAIAALLETSGNVAAAARISGIGQRTLHRWIKDDPTFAAALHEARGQALQLSVSRLTMATGGAVETLVSICDNKKASHAVRVQAAQAILSHAGRFIDTLDIMQRLEALEGKNENT